MLFNPKLISPSEFPFLKKETAHEYLNVINVDPKYENFVRIFDENENYVLVHYLSQTGFNDELMKYIGHVRGIIIDKKTREIVCKSWGYTPEKVVENYKDLPVQSHNYFIESREGTVLRLYYDKYTDKWVVSTHRKLCSTNFSKKFLNFDILDENGNDKTGLLNKTMVYVFLISCQQNSLVYTISKDSVLYVTNWVQSTGMFLNKNPFSSVFKKQKQTQNDSGQVTFEKLVEETTVYTKENCSELFNKKFNVFSRAAILTIDDFNCVTPTIVKYLDKDYYELKTLRGNTPNLKYRYFELINEPEELKNLINVFNDKFSKSQLQMAEYELDQLAKKIHSMYLERYIYKNIKQLPKEEFVTLQRCHAWYLEHKGSKITYDIVKNLLKTTACYYLIRMIKRLKK